MFWQSQSWYNYVYTVLPNNRYFKIYLDYGMVYLVSLSIVDSYHIGSLEGKRSFKIAGFNFIWRFHYALINP